MNILLAPHCDDELIGCHLSIKRGIIDLVVYVDPPVGRLKFADIAGKELGFSVGTVDFKDLHTFLERWNDLENHIIFVPDVADNHPRHKAVNLMGRMSGCRLGYYSTDMNTGYTKELSNKDKKEKREMLNRYYPDQKSLWENNWKYFLFEGVVTDFQVEG